MSTSSQHTKRANGRITYGFWLIFSEDGGVDLRRTKPSVGRSQRAMLVEASLPAALFRTPELKAILTVDGIPDRGVIEGKLQVAADALREVLGADLDVRLSVPRA